MKKAILVTLLLLMGAALFAQAQVNVKEVNQKDDGIVVVYISTDYSRDFPIDMYQPVILVSGPRLRGEFVPIPQTAILDSKYRRGEGEFVIKLDQALLRMPLYRSDADDLLFKAMLVLGSFESQVFGPVDVRLEENIMPDDDPDDPYANNHDVIETDDDPPDWGDEY